MAQAPSPVVRQKERTASSTVDVVGNLLSVAIQERVNPVKDDARQSDCWAKTLQQDHMVDVAEGGGHV